MEDLDQNLIERYLSDELTPAERSAVEQRAMQDDPFRRSLDGYRLAIESLKIAQREELKNRFRERDKVLDKRTAPGKGKTIRVVLSAVIGILLVLMTWKLLQKPQGATDQMKNEGKDTLQRDQAPPVKIDTVQVNQPHPDEKDAPGKVEEKKDPKQSKNKGKELFAANFEAYTDDSMDPSMRGDDARTPLEKFQANYWERKYPETISAFNNLSPSMQQNDNLRFVYANALMAVNRTDEAEAILKAVSENPKSIYRVEAFLYLAMIKIRNGKFAEAEKTLKSYLENPEASQKEKASRILAALQ